MHPTASLSPREDLLNANPNAVRVRCFLGEEERRLLQNAGQTSNRSLPAQPQQLGTCVSLEPTGRHPVLPTDRRGTVGSPDQRHRTSLWSRFRNTPLDGRASTAAGLSPTSVHGHVQLHPHLGGGRSRGVKLPGEDLEQQVADPLRSRRRRRPEAELPDAAVWVALINLEFHHGVFTSQAKTKQRNRRVERLFREVELRATRAAVETPGVPVR